MPNEPHRRTLGWDTHRAALWFYARLIEGTVATLRDKHHAAPSDEILAVIRAMEYYARTGENHPNLLVGHGYATQICPHLRYNVYVPVFESVDNVHFALQRFFDPGRTWGGYGLAEVLPEERLDEIEARARIWAYNGGYSGDRPDLEAAIVALLRTQAPNYDEIKALVQGAFGLD